MYICQNKVTNTWVPSFGKVVKYLTQACSWIVLMFYASFRGPSWFFTLVKQKYFEGFLLLLVVYNFGLPARCFMASDINMLSC